MPVSHATEINFMVTLVSQGIFDAKTAKDAKNRKDFLCFSLRTFAAFATFASKAFKIDFRDLFHTFKAHPGVIAKSGCGSPLQGSFLWRDVSQGVALS